jgi:hypothetical protein
VHASVQGALLRCKKGIAALGYRFFRTLAELILYFETVKPLPSMPAAQAPCGPVVVLNPQPTEVIDP